jgi:multidrug efflux pump subunit AcrA (membrane-fusion protein)
VPEESVRVQLQEAAPDRRAGRRQRIAAACRVRAGGGGRRRRLPAVGALALMGGIFMTLVATRGQSAQLPQPLDVPGHLEASQTTPLDFRVAGQVVTVNVRLGQAVTPGTVLASLDTATLTAQLATARSVLTTAQQKLSLDADASPGALAEATALAGVDAAQQQANGAATALNDTRALTLAALQGTQLGQLAAGKQLLAAAQAQLAAAQANLTDTTGVDQTTVDAARQVLDAAQTAGGVQVQTGRVQLNAAQKAASDTAQVSSQNVAVAQATLSGAQSIVAQDQATLTNDQQQLATDQATKVTDCAGTNTQLCAADTTNVNNDQAKVNADQQTLTKDQATVTQDQATVTQVQATGKLSNDQAQGQASAAQAALNGAQAAFDTARSAAQVALDQELAKGAQATDQAAVVVRLARIALQSALDTTSGTAGQNALDQLRLKAQQAIDQTQIQLEASVVAANSARRTRAALHAPPAVQLVLTDQSAVDNARAQVDLAQHNVSGATLVAPFHGIVEQLNIAQGQQIAGGAATAATGGAAAGATAAGAAAAAAAPATAALTHAIVLQTPDAFQLTGSVREADVVKVKLGDRVSVVTAASPQAFDGAITDIAPAGTIRGNLVTFALTATFEAPGTGLRPGMSARMRILGVTAGGTSAGGTTTSTATTTTDTTSSDTSSDTSSSDTASSTSTSQP